MSTKAVQNSEASGTARQQPSKLNPPTGLLRKLTTKLKPLNLRPRSAIPKIASPPTSPLQPSPRRAAVPSASTDLAAIKRRNAALQQCGLVRRDLSQLEQELDCKFSRIVDSPPDELEQGELTTAERIRREWQSRNETQVEKQGDGPSPMLPSDVTSAALHPGPHGKSDLARNAQEQQTSEPPNPTSPQMLLTLATPVSLDSIPGAFSFPDIPEEAVVALSKIDKALPPPPPKDAVEPLGIPLPDSPLSSSANLPELLSIPSLPESKRRPQIILDVTTNDTKENAEGITHGRSLTTKSSLPALSPTMTASSFSSIPTPRDDESMERIETIITRSNSGTSRARFGKASDIGRDSEDLDVVHETIHESPEPTTTEPKTGNPNRESTPTVGPAGPEALAEKRAKRRMSTGIFQSNKRGSGSISRKSTGSERSFRWGTIANDFSLKPLDGRKSRSSTLFSVPASVDENHELTPTPSQILIEQPQSKISRSKSVIASLGLKMSRKVPLQRTIASLPSPPPLPVRQPTATIMHNRERLMQDVKGIEDDESRRLTELAFMDF